MPKGRWPRGVTAHPRSGAAAERSYPASEVRGGGREDQPHVQGAVAARGAGGPRRSYPTLKVRKKGGEEIPLVQGKEQRLHFAGAAVKR